MEQARAIGKNFDFVTWTASQVAGDENKEKKSKRTKLSGARGKVRPADLVISISDDGSLSIEKNRNGPSYINLQILSDIFDENKNKSCMKMRLRNLTSKCVSVYKILQSYKNNKNLLYPSGLPEVFVYTT